MRVLCIKGNVIMDAIEVESVEMARNLLGKVFDDFEASPPVAGAPGPGNVRATAKAPWTEAPPDENVPIVVTKADLRAMIATVAEAQAVETA